MFQSKNYHRPEDVISIGDELSLWREVVNWCDIEDIELTDLRGTPTGTIFYIHAPGCEGYFKLPNSEWDKLGKKGRYCLPLEWYNRLLNCIRIHLPFSEGFWRKLVYDICLEQILRTYKGRQLSGHAIAKPEVFEWINAQYKKYNGELPPLGEIAKFQVKFFGDLPKTGLDMLVQENTKTEEATEECMKEENEEPDKKPFPGDKISVDLRNYLLNPGFWEYNPGGKVHYVCHDYAFSDSVEDDICKRCSKAKCDNYSGSKYPLIYTEPEKLTLKKDMYRRFCVDQHFPSNESLIHEYVNASTFNTMIKGYEKSSDNYTFFLINEVRYPIKDESLLPLAKEFYEVLFKIHRASKEFDLKKEDE